MVTIANGMQRIALSGQSKSVQSTRAFSSAVSALRAGAEQSCHDAQEVLDVSAKAKYWNSAESDWSTSETSLCRSGELA